MLKDNRLLPTGNERVLFMKRIVSLLLLLTIFFAGLPIREVSAASNPYCIKVNRQTCTITIYEKDAQGKYTVPVKAMLCSPSDYTPLGTFQTPAKYRWRLLVGDVWGQYSTRITGSILFHSVWYYELADSRIVSGLWSLLQIYFSYYWLIY